MRKKGDEQLTFRDKQVDVTNQLEIGDIGIKQKKKKK